jgi:hypothetical protein
MSKRDFFILSIRLFGLSSLVTSVFSVVPSNIAFALMDFDIVSAAWVLMAVAVIVALFVLLVTKADKVVQVLKLEKGFDDSRIELGSLKSRDVIKIGTFIIGGLLILDNVPGFLSHALFAFKGMNAGTEYRMEDKFNWMVSAINLLIGYLLLTNYGFVADKMRNDSEDEATTPRSN